MPAKVMQLRDKIESAVGGLFSTVKVPTIVVLEKSVYRIGDTIRARISCDNTKCANDVKGFKIKLKRKTDLTGHFGNSKPFKVHDSEYVAAFKTEKGCKAGASLEMILELVIPATVS
jgi:hypothetical protein